MRTSLIAPGETDALAATPYRRDRRSRRHLQSLDADGEGGEADYLDASDDPEIIRACSEAHTSNDELSLCETNGFESAVRFMPFQTRTHYTQPVLTIACATVCSGSCTIWAGRWICARSD
jgi:hypothetical protein